MILIAKLRTAAAAAAVALSASTFAAALPEQAVQWEVANTARVQATVPYELHNSARRNLGFSTQLGYLAIDRPWPNSDCHHVGWVGHSGGHFVFFRPNTRDHRTIRDDESVALYNTKIRMYLTGLQFKDKISGTHFVWSKSPAYEWQVHRQTNETGPRFALFNLRNRDYLTIVGEGSLNNGKFAILGWITARPAIGVGSRCPVLD
jgi:hypothetical protein